MKLLLELSMEVEPLSRSEALSATAALGDRGRVLASAPGIMVLETSVDPLALSSRVALCHSVSELLGSCDPASIGSRARRIQVEGPIRVRSTAINRAADSSQLDRITRAVGAALGRSSGVDLQSPRTDIRVLVSDKAYLGRLVAKVDRTSYERRKNRFMPFQCPISVHPKFARALVNLSRVGAGGRLLDPFCGTGAIVAEAALAGVRAVGSDLSEDMVKGASRNLRHLGLEADLETCDIGSIPEMIGTVDGIATDPPYGRATSTNGEGIGPLYRRAFRAFGEVLAEGSRVAMVVPDSALIRRVEGFRLKEKHSMRVHRSLTRHFCVLERS